MFSSLDTQSSTALSDYSVFTKSFADALVAYVGGDVCYVDITKHIADDLNVKKYQTPLFIQQATNTESFCHVSADLVKKIMDKFSAISKRDEKNENDETSQNVQTLEEKLLSAVNKKNAEFCTEQEAQISLAKLVKSVENHDWSALMKLYEITTETKEDYSGITGIDNVAKWLSENNEPYFARVEYKKEPYEVDEFSVMRVDFHTVKKYRNVPSTIKQTATSPCHSITITFSPKHQVTPWFKVFVVHIFSKNKLTLFYKYEAEKEANWNERKTLNVNKWKILHCSLNNTTEIIAQVADMLNDVNQSITNELKSRFNI
ncbi:MAG: hypothetical protein WAW36_14250 [Methylovulum miyakonense]|uniref:hypothetical protein n=1 Tax=Methylovulum miyakonense TaxID=645578 RepID=UPI003BB5FA27